jgi:hypothetical protein
MMMTAAAAAHMAVAVAMTALHLDHGIAGLGGERACWNAWHCGRRRRQGCERQGDKACLDKSFHGDLLHRRSRQLAQVPERVFVPGLPFSQHCTKTAGVFRLKFRYCRFFPNIFDAGELSR